MQHISNIVNLVYIRVLLTMKEFVISQQCKFAGECIKILSK